MKNNLVIFGVFFCVVFSYSMSIAAQGGGINAAGWEERLNKQRARARNLARAVKNADVEAAQESLNGLSKQQIQLNKALASASKKYEDLKACDLQMKQGKSCITPDGVNLPSSSIDLINTEISQAYNEQKAISDGLGAVNGEISSLIEKGAEMPALTPEDLKNAIGYQAQTQLLSVNASTIAAANASTATTLNQLANDFDKLEQSMDKSDYGKYLADKFGVFVNSGLFCLAKNRCQGDPTDKKRIGKDQIAAELFPNTDMREHRQEKDRGDLKMKEDSKYKRGGGTQ